MEKTASYQAFHPELSQGRRWAVLVCFVAAGAISIMSQLTMTTCLPAIVAEFGIDTAHGQWLTTSYMLALGVMVPCTGYLTARFESRYLFLAANLLFLAGLLGACAPSFGALVVVRCLQGLAAGVFIPLMQIVAFRLFEPGRRGFAMGVSAVALAAGPVLGPTLAGVCTDLWGWRSVFVCVAVLTVAALASYPVIAVLRESVGRPPFDAASALLGAVGFAGVIAGASGLGSPDALLGGVLPLALGTGALAVFVRRQLALEHPLLDLRPFRDAGFSLGVVACALIFGTLINIETFMSIYIQGGQGFSPTDAALCLLPGSLVSAVLAPFTGRILDRRGPFGLACAGFGLMVVAGAMFALVEASSPLWYSAVAFALRCAGNGCIMQNIQTWAVNRLPGAQMTHGTAIANTLRQVGGALVNAVLFALMGALAPTMGEFAAIRVALAASAGAVAVMGVVALVRLRGEGPRVR